VTSAGMERTYTPMQQPRKITLGAYARLERKAALTLPKRFERVGPVLCRHVIMRMGHTKGRRYFD